MGQGSGRIVAGLDVHKRSTRIAVELPPPGTPVNPGAARRVRGRVSGVASGLLGIPPHGALARPDR
jgi:hypothetical protein